jgi:hypothetical protein
MPWRCIGEWRYSYTHSLTSALDGSEWSASRPGRFTPRERAPDTHWTGGWLGPRAVLAAVVKRKIPSPRRKSNPRTPIVQLVAQRYTDWVITATYLKIYCYVMRPSIYSCNRNTNYYRISDKNRFKSSKYTTKGPAWVLVRDRISRFTFHVLPQYLRTNAGIIHEYK